jgi:hypothetical protein
MQYIKDKKDPRIRGQKFHGSVYPPVGIKTKEYLYIAKSYRQKY